MGWTAHQLDPQKNPAGPVDPHLSPVTYAHTVEWDEYYTLTPQGRQNLQGLAHWHNAKHAMKVRRTFVKATGEMKAQIVKTRVSDLEVFNPNSAFDYRISISLETPWNGEASELMPDEGGPRGGGAGAGANDRQKDRVSYKHHDYQIDLTQIEHSSGAGATVVNGTNRRAEHEAEIEIMNHSILPALEEAREGRGERLEGLLDGFVDNVRILCHRAGVVVGGGGGGGPQGQGQGVQGRGPPGGGR